MRLLVFGPRSGIAWSALLIVLTGCITPKPQIAPPAGLYQCPLKVSITDQRSRAKIFYTTDGSTATASSPTYLSPFALNQSENVKSVAKAGSSKTSGVTTANYTCAMTRGEFAQLIAQRFHLPPPKQELPYSDVTRQDPRYGALQAAGLFMDYQVMCPHCQLATLFVPDRALTRAVSTLALVRILVVEQRIRLLTPAESERELGNVRDVGEIPAAARPYFATALANGILKVGAGNSIQPGKLDTQEELNAVLDDIQKRFTSPSGRPNRACPSQTFNYAAKA